MHHHAHSLIWRSTPFHFERLGERAGDTATAEWAVSRVGEFIGTMPCPAEVTTREFEVCCRHWLGELFEVTAR
jgi:hypothetical protein